MSTSKEQQEAQMSPRNPEKSRYAGKAKNRYMNTYFCQNEYINVVFCEQFCDTVVFFCIGILLYVRYINALALTCSCLPPMLIRVVMFGCIIAGSLCSIVSVLSCSVAVCCKISVADCQLLK